MSHDLRGRRALVTGASSGLGVEFARQLAAAGADLVLVARRRDRLETLAAELSEREGIDARVEALDLATPDAPDILLGRTEGDGLAVDLLINNAGFGVYGDYLTIPWERERQMIQLDIMAVAHLTKVFAAPMVERGWGRILQVASIASYQPVPTYSVYGAAKAFVRDFSEAVSVELEPHGVSSTVLSPGVTRTEFFDVAGQQRRTLYQRLLMMSSARVAKIGLRALLAQRRSVVPGIGNRIGAFSTRLVPRSVATRVAHVTMRND
ncbi:MAG: SDR family oxidoreductase [Acidobacteriota bacterium]